MDERQRRLCSVLEELDADWAVFTQADSICYASGHIVPIEWGVSPFSGGACTAFLSRDGACGLVVPNHEVGACYDGVEVEAYVGFDYHAPADIQANYTRAVEALRQKLGVSGVLAIEPQSFTSAIDVILTPTDRVSISRALARVRSTKTDEEITALTYAALAAAAGQNAALSTSGPGISELDAFSSIRAAIENEAGGRVPLAGDYLSGVERTSGGMGWPNTRTLTSNDPILCDLAPRVEGYWGDSCASFVLGDPSDVYLQLFNRVKTALDLAQSIIKPGLTIDELDRTLRAEVERDGLICHHHMGHSIGTSVHEWPRIIPGEKAHIEQDMVLMIEPGCYQPGVGGVRLEWMFQVTTAGVKPLAPFEHTPMAAA